MKQLTEEVTLMAVSEQAKRNHDELFPGHVSTLAVTDPELIEVFDNFAFDEVLRHGGLDPRFRLMVQLASMIASQALAEYQVMLGATLTVGVTPVEAREIVYQAVPYVGMAKVFDFLHATNDVLTQRGVQPPMQPQATSTPEDRMDKGLAKQQEIVGSDVVDAMYDAAPDDEMHLQRYLTGNCFGDYVARAGLDVRTRELLTFAMLVSLGGCEPQVKGHVAANLRVGNDRAVLLSVLTQILPFIGYPRTLNGLRVLDEAAPAAASMPAS
jgi:4-carboxymuconolactone decarboxylase